MKVFISSTYKDLIDYRASAIRAVEGTNYQAGKMEAFGARSDEPTVACLKEVEECEIFIGIYALRYGHILDGADISITEMEYVHAKKLDKEIYCFILDEENQGWLTKWIEDEPGKTKLKDFKKGVQKLHVCDYFTTPDDLRAKVAGALSHFVANHNGSSVSDQTCPLPKSTGNSLPREGFFVGRDAERKTIAAALSPESRTWGALIDGPGGIGKTALAIKAAHEVFWFSVNWRIDPFELEYKNGEIHHAKIEKKLHPSRKGCYPETASGRSGSGLRPVRSIRFATQRLLPMAEGVF